MFNDSQRLNTIKQKVKSARRLSLGKLGSIIQAQGAENFDPCVLSVNSFQ